MVARVVRFLRAMMLWTMVAAGGAGLHAHPVSLTSMVANAEDDGLVVELAVMAEDLVLLYDLEADASFRYPEVDLLSAAERHGFFLLEALHIRDRAGHRMEGRVAAVEASQIPAEGIFHDDLMAYSIFYRLEYPFDEKPAFLTVAQFLGGDPMIVPAEMGVRFFHHGVHMETFVLTHGMAHTVSLDWEAGWERARDDLDAARERLRQRQADALGITSYSAVYSFIYVTRNEVRHELLVPLLTLETWLPLGREGADTMTVAEQRAAWPVVEEFLRRYNSAVLDGHEVEGHLTRLDFFGPEFRDFARRPPETEVSIYNARVGLVFTFPAERPPSLVTLGWRFFNERLPRLVSSLFLFDDGRSEAVFTPLRRTFVWEGEVPMAAANAGVEPAPEGRSGTVSFLPLFLAGAAAAGWLVAVRRRRKEWSLFAIAPAVGILAVGAAIFSMRLAHSSAPALADEEARELVEALQRQLYLSFNYKEDERVYDALVRITAGPALERIFLQTRQGIASAEAGGAASSISEVNVLDGGVIRRTRSGFDYRLAWTVTGRVEHWGHVHTRTNRYEGDMTVEHRPEGWRITRLEPAREEAVSVQIALRR